MNNRIKELARTAEREVQISLGERWTTVGRAEFMRLYNEKFAELIVKKCAYLVNDYQRTTGYTDHAKMLCREFDIEYKDEDYYGVE